MYIWRFQEELKKELVLYSHIGTRIVLGYENEITLTVLHVYTWCVIQLFHKLGQISHTGPLKVPGNCSLVEWMSADVVWPKTKFRGLWMERCAIEDFFLISELMLMKLRSIKDNHSWCETCDKDVWGRWRNVVCRPSRRETFFYSSS